MQYHLQSDQQKMLLVLDLVGFHSIIRSDECSKSNNDTTCNKDTKLT